MLRGRRTGDRKLTRKTCTSREYLLSDNHFSVDGTLIEAWASVKSFRSRDDGGPGDDSDGGSISSQIKRGTGPTGRNAERDFRGDKRSNATHASTTDPDARLFKKSRRQTANLSHMAHVLIENRNGLVVDAILTHANGSAERAALNMLGPLKGAIGLRWARTRTATPPHSSKHCARWRSPRM